MTVHDGASFKARRIQEGEEALVSNETIWLTRPTSYSRSLLLV